MKTPQFLRTLMSSPAYMDKNSNTYAMAEKYLKMLYPGALAHDATGRMTEPKYDMTLEQFRKAQKALESALEEAIANAEAEYEEAGRRIDVEDHLELEETIDVRQMAIPSAASRFQQRNQHQRQKRWPTPRQKKQHLKSRLIPSRDNMRCSMEKL